MNIYVASSWSNNHQPKVVKILELFGHIVYDFKNPTEKEKGFHWDNIDKEWKHWNSKDYRKALLNPIALNGFRRDIDSIVKSDVCFMVLPCGRSAHLEAGFLKGLGKKLFIYIPEGEFDRPDLMYLMADGILTSLVELEKTAHNLITGKYNGRI